MGNAPLEGALTLKDMTPEQILAQVNMEVARANLAYARLACEAIPGSSDTVRRLAQAVQSVEAADRDYMAAMTAGLAAQISEIVPDAFRE